MDLLTDFIANNLVVVIIVGVILVIVGDEVLGVTRGIFGDDVDDLPATPQARARDEAAAREAQEVEDDDAPTAHDLLSPKKRR